MLHSGNRLFKVCLVVIALGVALPAFAAETPEAARIRELEAKLERSLQMIEALQLRVQQIEAANANTAIVAAPPQPNEHAVRIETLENQVAQLGSGLSSRQGETGTPVHGFADVGMRYSNENNSYFGKGNKGFNLGTFDLYFTPHFGANVRMLAEPNIEVHDDGSVDVDIERLQLGYAVSDSFTAWIGRFHSPFGYWNTAFHHGAQIQTTVLRPRFLAFEDYGGILPIHTTGLWITGTLPSGNNKFGYDLYVGNSQRIKTDAANPVGPGQVPTGSLDMKVAGSSSFNAVTGFKAWVSPAGLPDLQVGLHGLRGNIATDGANNVILNQTRLQMLGGYGVFTDDNWEVIGEYYHFNNDDISGGSGTHQSSSWYAQGGYNFGRYTPYVRLEKATLDQHDGYFAYQTNGRSYQRSLFGVRYEVDPNSALKIEANHTKKRDLVDSNGAPVADDGYFETYVQYSVRF